VTLLLWRWSTLVQVTSVLVITLFFIVLARSVGRVELRWWVRSWLVNTGALAVANLYWVWQPTELWLPLLRSAYMGLKIACLLLLAQAAWAFVRPNAVLLTRRAWIAFGTVAALSGFVIDTIPKVGVAAQGSMTLILGAAAVAVARSGDRALTWLTVGLAIRAFLGGLETGAYVTQLLPAGALDPGLLESVGVFLAAHSSFDSVSEWLLALGCVLALMNRTQRELRRYNDDLLAAQEGLRRLVDRDPLTALANRRALPEVFREVQPLGATLLFFDLDGFKKINDAHGHAAGDACLKRFADTLRQCFRPQDTLVRYAGDEFLVVAPGLTTTNATERLDQLRILLHVPDAKLPPIRFSVGISSIAAGGDVSEAVRVADEAMYNAKRERRSRAVA
jgi:diguanylate cyclase (GGDEF)-like protein